MTPKEFESILGRMDDHQFKAFAKEYGGEMDRSRYVRHFMENPKLEERLCQILRVPTEDDKNNDVALATMRAEQEQAAAALRSNQLAAEANRIAWIALIVAGLALLVSVAAICVSATMP